MVAWVGGGERSQTEGWGRTSFQLGGRFLGFDNLVHTAGIWGRPPLALPSGRTAGAPPLEQGQGAGRGGGLEEESLLLHLGGV